MRLLKKIKPQLEIIRLKLLPSRNNSAMKNSSYFKLIPVWVWTILNVVPGQNGSQKKRAKENHYGKELL